MNEAIEILESLRARLGEVTQGEFLNSLAKAYMEKGGALSESVPDKAIEACDMAIEIWEGLRARLGEDTPVEILDDLAGVYAYKATALTRLQRLDDALCVYNVAVEILSGMRTRLGESAPAEFLSVVAMANLNKGLILRRLDQRPELSRSCFQVAHDIWDDLVKRYPQSSDYHWRHNMVVLILDAI